MIATRFVFTELCTNDRRTARRSSYRRSLKTVFAAA